MFIDKNIPKLTNSAHEQKIMFICLIRYQSKRNSAINYISEKLEPKRIIVMKKFVSGISYKSRIRIHKEQISTCTIILRLTNIVTNRPTYTSNTIIINYVLTYCKSIGARSTQYGRKKGSQIVIIEEQIIYTLTLYRSRGVIRDPENKKAFIW